MENAVITPIFKKGDIREQKKNRPISILNACYKICCKSLNMKRQKYSEVFMTETKFDSDTEVRNRSNIFP